MTPASKPPSVRRRRPRLRRGSESRARVIRAARAAAGADAAGPRAGPSARGLAPLADPVGTPSCTPAERTNHMAATGARTGGVGSGRRRFGRRRLGRRRFGRRRFGRRGSAERAGRRAAPAGPCRATERAPRWRPRRVCARCTPRASPPRPELRLRPRRRGLRDAHGPRLARVVARASGPAQPAGAAFPASVDRRESRSRSRSSSRSGSIDRESAALHVIGAAPHAWTPADRARGRGREEAAAFRPCRPRPSVRPGRPPLWTTTLHRKSTTATSASAAASPSSRPSVRPQTAAARIGERGPPRATFACSRGAR